MNSRAQRAIKQPIYLLNVERKNMIWKFQVLGASTNAYQVDIMIYPLYMTCTCPDFIRNRKPCKHIFNILYKVPNNKTLFHKLAYDYAISEEDGVILDKSMERRMRHWLSRGSIIGKGDDCSICLDTMHTSINKCDGCGNTFHTECITKWLSERSTCPLCRKKWIMSTDFPMLAEVNMR